MAPKVTAANCWYCYLGLFCSCWLWIFLKCRSPLVSAAALELWPHLCTEPFLPEVHAVAHKRSEVPSLWTSSELFCTLMRDKCLLKGWLPDLNDFYALWWMENRSQGNIPACGNLWGCSLVCCVADVDLSNFCFFFLWGSFPSQTNESIIINILFSEQSLSHFYKWKNQGMGRLHGWGEMMILCWSWGWNQVEFCGMCCLWYHPSMLWGDREGASLCTSMHQSGLLCNHMLCISAIQKTSSFSSLQLYLPSMLQKNVMTGNYQANHL